MNKIEAIKKILEYRYLIIGKKFNDLDNDEKQTLYATDLYNDCKDIQIVADSVIGAHPNYIDTQLRVAFLYTDESIIP